MPSSTIRRQAFGGLGPGRLLHLDTAGRGREWPQQLVTKATRFVDMKRVIRHRTTGEFFNAGSWTLSAALAQDFPDISDILKTCAQYHLKDVELVVALGNEPLGMYPIRVPIPTSD